MMGFRKRKERKTKEGVSRLFLAVSVVAIICALLLMWNQRQFGEASVIIGEDVVVDVEIASTPPAWERGLSGHEPLADGEGMLFVFGTDAVYSFWMKDMTFPIDIIWIKGGEIVDITNDVPLPDGNAELVRYQPSESVDSVLEVPAGYAERTGIRQGDAVRILFPLTEG